MKKLFILTALFVSLFALNTQAQDTCKCPKNVPVTKKHETKKAALKNDTTTKPGAVTNVDIAITNVMPRDTASRTMSQTVYTSKSSGDGTSYGSVGLILLGGLLILALVGLFIYGNNRGAGNRHRALHEFIDNESINSIGNNGGYLSHTTPAGERLHVRLNNPTNFTVQLRNNTASH